MAVMVKTLGYYSQKGGAAAQGLSKLKSHLKYLEHGKVHENDPRGFDQESDRVRRSEFLNAVSRQPERGVIAHKLVLSLSQDERDRLGVSLKDVARDVMAAWESKLGRELNWIGFEHEDKRHPHVHIVVAGYADGKQVGIYERDLHWMRSTADRSKEALSLQQERGVTREPSPQREAQRLLAQTQEIIRPLTRILDMILGRDRGIERGRDRDR